MKRVKPFWKDHWLENLEMYMRSYDFWEVGITEELEREVLKICPRKHALIVDSTSNAIWMNLYLWKKKYPNRHKVLFPNWGYPAVFKACKVLGLTPCPVDMSFKTLGMNPILLAEELKDENVLCVAHIESNGVIGDPETMREIIPEEVLFIEDSAPSMLQLTAGTYGDVAMFSFSPTKPFCVGGGSVIVTDNTKFYEELKNLRHTPNYRDKSPTLNFMMSPYLMPLLQPQFAYFGYLHDMRTMLHIHYRRHLKIFEEPIISSNAHGSIMYLSEKAECVSEALLANDIQHRYKGYPCYDENVQRYPISNEIRQKLIDLPMHHEMDEKDVYKICNIIKEVENA